MPRIVTRPVIDIIASVIRRSWRSVVGARHWLKQAKTVIISGMGGGSSCKVGLGNPYSTRCCRSTHLHFYTVLSHPISSPFLAKVLLQINRIIEYQSSEYVRTSFFPQTT